MARDCDAHGRVNLAGTLDFTVDDLGASGAGGPLTTTRTIPVFILSDE